MTLDEIQAAVNAGHKVCWANTNYEVVKDHIGQWFIVCRHNGYAIGLTWRDGTTLNGKPEDFFIRPTPQPLPA